MITPEDWLPHEHDKQLEYIRADADNAYEKWKCDCGTQGLDVYPLG